MALAIVAFIITGVLLNVAGHPWWGWFLLILGILTALGAAVAQASELLK